MQDDAQTVEAEFKPNLVNTVCYLVQSAVQLITFVVNYVGHPFQTPLLENKAMMASLRFSILGFLVMSSGWIPQVQHYLELVHMPPGLKAEMFAGLGIVIVGSFVLENSLRAMFPAFTPPRKGYMGLLHLLPQDHRLKKDL
jgi:manganese-transporting P-type ATPase